MIPDQLIKHRKGNCKNYELISVSELSKYSKYKVEVICDYCGSHYYESYFLVNQKHARTGVDKDSCRNCIKYKRIEINMMKYGVEYPSQLDCIKKKIKETNMQKYGCENPMQNKDIYQKAQQTLINKFGTCNINKIPEIAEKAKLTRIEKYGSEYYFETEEFKSKAKETFKEKYGVEHPMQNDDYRESVHKSLIKKYGVDNISQIDDVKQKKKETCIKHWGATSFTGSEAYKEMCMERYGCECALLQPYVREKITKSFYANGSCPTSQAQLWIYNYLKDIGLNVELNYPVSRANLDVALFCCQKQIDIEFDGRHWHQDKTKDSRRDFFMLDNQWNVIRFIGDRNPPNETQLLDAINKSLYENRRRLIINLN